MSAPTNELRQAVETAGRALHDFLAAASPSYAAGYYVSNHRGRKKLVKIAKRGSKR